MCIDITLMQGRKLCEHSMYTLWLDCLHAMCDIMCPNIWGVNSAKSSIFSFVCPKHICMSKTHLTVHK